MQQPVFTEMLCTSYHAVVLGRYQVPVWLALLRLLYAALIAFAELAWRRYLFADRMPDSCGRFVDEMIARLAKIVVSAPLIPADILSDAVIAMERFYE